MNKSRGNSIAFSKLSERRAMALTYELARRLEAMFVEFPYEVAP